MMKAEYKNFVQFPGNSTITFFRHKMFHPKGLSEDGRPRKHPHKGFESCFSFGNSRIDGRSWYHFLSFRLLYIFINLNISELSPFIPALFIYSKFQEPLILSKKIKFQHSSPQIIHVGVLEVAEGDSAPPKLIEST